MHSLSKPNPGRRAKTGPVCFCLAALLAALPAVTGADAETNSPAPAATSAPSGKTNAPAAPTIPAAPASGDEGGKASRSDLASFNILNERNIFNPNRSSRASRERKVEKVVKTDTFTLAGTMSYVKGDFAFFDGSSSEFRKSVTLNDKIGGYTVVSITPDKVTLEANGKSIELAVGAQMRRQDEGPWEKIAASNERYSAKTGSSSTSSSSGSGDSGGDDDALKRLLKKREEELNK
ncbi:MAG TPA: hypothetical protein VHH73_16715 [Verrucomicrobiae bacterium]|nr:hypothetical protein [Verrucomicrobiae bacterium]